MSLPSVKMNGDRPLAPRVTAFTARFWEALAAGQLLATRCGDCDRCSFPPKEICPACLGANTAWIELGGRGLLYSVTRVHAGPACFAGDIPYSIGIVDSDEGLRLVTRLVGDVGPEHLDVPVEFVVTRYRDGPLFAARLCDAVTPIK